MAAIRGLAINNISNNKLFSNEEQFWSLKCLYWEKILSIILMKPVLVIGMTSDSNLFYSAYSSSLLEEDTAIQRNDMKFIYVKYRRSLYSHYWNILNLYVMKLWSVEEAKCKPSIRNMYSLNIDRENRKYDS